MHMTNNATILAFDRGSARHNLPEYCILRDRIIDWSASEPITQCLSIDIGAENNTDRCVVILRICIGKK